MNGRPEEPYSDFGRWLAGIANAVTTPGYRIPPPPQIAPATKVDIPVAATPGMGLLGPQPIVLDVEVRAGMRAGRAVLNESGYGRYVNDGALEHFVAQVLIEAAKARASA